MTLCFATANKVVFVRQKERRIHEFFSAPYLPFNSALVGSVSRDISLSSHKPTGWLPPPPPLFFPLSVVPRSDRARLTPERQQNVPALHLHVCAALNKLNGVLMGHWELISASPCTSVATGIYHPIIPWSSFACNRFEVPSSSGDGYKNQRLDR